MMQRIVYCLNGRYQFSANYEEFVVKPNRDVLRRNFSTILLNHEEDTVWKRKKAFAIKPCVKHIHQLVASFKELKSDAELKDEFKKSEDRIKEITTWSKISNSMPKELANPKKHYDHPNDSLVDNTFNKVENSKAKTFLDDAPSLDQLSAILAIPIPKKPIFPGFLRIIRIKNNLLKKAILALDRNEKHYACTFLLRKGYEDVEKISQENEIYNVGTLNTISSIQNAPNGQLLVGLSPICRVRLKQFRWFDEYGNLFDKENPVEKNLMVKVFVESLELQPYDPQSLTIITIVSEIKSTYKEILQSLNPSLHDLAFRFINNTLNNGEYQEAANIADAAAALGSGTEEEFQIVMSSTNIKERLQSALVVLKNERMSIILVQKIGNTIEKKITTKNREFWLKEQMKEIKKELGTGYDTKDGIISKYEEIGSNLNMPTMVRSQFEQELSRFSNLETMNLEYNISRNYLDWLTSIPWGIYSEDQLNVQEASKILDQDHFGLADIKDRILEFIAVSKLRKKVAGKIICFVGPPGVGKTSMGKSIARCLNRKFYRFSVGGLNDIAEIKGHRRTYVGALPGRIVQALKISKTQNPVIMIDEIDKLSHSVNGNPASALLEALDEEQNHSFMDHYLDVPCDLSRVLFICTANTTDRIPEPLLDRMEVINLSGYIHSEKIAIAKKHLIPKARKSSGLNNIDIEFEDATLDSLLVYYCRENGVRNLKNLIDRIFRKTSFNIVRMMESENNVVKEIRSENSIDKKLNTDNNNEKFLLRSDKKVETGIVYESQSVSEVEKKTDEFQSVKKLQNQIYVDRGKFQSKEKFNPDSKIIIRNADLLTFLGPSVYTDEDIYQDLPIGVATGLAWTSKGGSITFVEAILDRPLEKTVTPRLHKTGKLGDVMKESVELAYTYSKGFLLRKIPTNEFFQQASIHVHCPAGAISKDGPSAGVTITTALLSLALNQTVPKDIAFTGELTLTGKVLRIGGLREKVIAARRVKIKRIVIPKDNMADWQNLPALIKAGVEVIPVNWYDELFKAVFTS